VALVLPVERDSALVAIAALTAAAEIAGEDVAAAEAETETRRKNGSR
jgi:hypothetical protein